MASFIPYDYSQNAMVVVNFQDQFHPVILCACSKGITSNRATSLPRATTNSTLVVAQEFKLPA